MEPIGPLLPQISLLDLSNQPYLFVYVKGSKKLPVFMWAGDATWDPFIFRFVFDIILVEALPPQIIWERAGEKSAVWGNAYVWDVTEVEVGSTNS